MAREGAVAADSNRQQPAETRYMAGVYLLGMIRTPHGVCCCWLATCKAGFWIPCVAPAQSGRADVTDMKKREMKKGNESQLSFWCLWHPKTPSGSAGGNGRVRAMTRTKPNASSDCKPRRLAASMCNGSKHSGRGLQSEHAAGLTGHGPLDVPFPE